MQRPDDILVAFAGSARQRRLTVLVRALLFIPHAIVVIGLSIAACVVVVIGWFAALVMGRLPAWAAGFLAGWLRYYARVTGYLWLLTDAYPPFALGDTDYPVRLAAAPGRLNRLAVFFRLILAIPVFILAALVSQGVGSIALLVIWAIVLIGGRMPDPLYEAAAAILRFVLRTSGYLCLLTATYPHGLFGDKPGAEAEGEAGPGAGYATLPPEAAADPAGGVPPAPAETAPAEPASAEPAAAEPASAEPALAEPAPAPAEPGEGEAALAGSPLATSGLRDWRLVLSDAGRNLVVMFLVLGVGVAFLNGYLGTTYGWGFGISVYVGAGSYSQRTDAVHRIGSADTVLISTMNGLQAKAAACQALPCLRTQDLRAAHAFDTFGSALRSADVPAGAAAAANARLEHDVTRISADFRKLASVTSVPQYRLVLVSTGLPQTLARFNADYRQLGVALGVLKR